MLRSIHRFDKAKKIQDTCDVLVLVTMVTDCYNVWGITGPLLHCCFLTHHAIYWDSLESIQSLHIHIPHEESFGQLKNVPRRETWEMSMLASLMKFSADEHTQWINLCTPQGSTCTM